MPPELPIRGSVPGPRYIFLMHTTTEINFTFGSSTKKLLLSVSWPLPALSSPIVSPASDTEHHPMLLLAYRSCYWPACLVAKNRDTTCKRGGVMEKVIFSPVNKGVWQSFLWGSWTQPR